MSLYTTVSGKQVSPGPKSSPLSPRHSCRRGSVIIIASLLVILIAHLVAYMVNHDHNSDFEFAIKRHDHNLDFESKIKGSPTLEYLQFLGFFNDQIVSENNYDIGTLLLKDTTGDKLKTMAQDHLTVHSMSREIFRRWLKGMGLQPVTWNTLIGVLNQSKLLTLSATVLNSVDRKHLDVPPTSSQKLVIKAPPNLFLLERFDVFNEGKDFWGSLVLDVHGSIMNNIADGKIYEDEKNREACTLWLQGKGKQPVTWRTFINIATEAKLVTLAKDIETSVDPEYLDTEPQLYPEPIIAKSMEDIKNTMYHNLHLFNLVVSPNPHFLSISVERLINAQSNQWHDVDIWQLINELDYTESVVIIGHPGAGKTSLMKYLTVLWTNNSTLQKCELLFYITLTNSDGQYITDLRSLLSRIVPWDANKIIVERIKARDGEGACFLLDSYEWSNDYVYKLIQGDELAHSLKIVTARPHDFFHKVRPNFQLKLLGFKRNDLPNHLEKASNNRSLINEVKSLWERQPNVMEFCTVPLLFSMVLSIVQTSGLEAPLNTRTEIYIAFMYNTLFQYNVSRPYPYIQECVVKNSGSYDSCQAFNVVLKVAFQSTFDGIHSFLDEESDKTLETIESMGIVSTELNGHKNKRIFTFSHPTFREFFAALYLAAQPLEAQLHYSTLYTPSWFSAFQFYFGIQNAYYKNISKISLILQGVSIHFTIRPSCNSLLHKACTFQINIELFDFIQELVDIRDTSRTNLLRESGVVKNFSLCIYSNAYKYHDAFVDDSIHSIYYRESTNGSSIAIEDWNYSIAQECNEFLMQMKNGLMKWEKCPGLTYLRFTIWDAGDLTNLLNYLDSQASGQLQTLHLDVIPMIFDRNLTAKLLSTLSKQNNLKDVTVDGLPLNYSDLHYISGTRRALPKVTGLLLVGKRFFAHVHETWIDIVYHSFLSIGQWVVNQIWQVEVGEKHDNCKFLALKDILDCPNELKRIKLKGASLFDHCTHFLNFTLLLKDLRGLQHLHITEVDVGRSGLHVYLKTSPLASNLVTLEISRHSMNDDEFESVFQNLPPNLEHLILDKVNLTDSHVDMLSKSLINLRKLHSLTLSSNKLTGSGLKVVLSSLLNGSVRSLDLSYSRRIFNNKAALEALGKLTHLRHLYLIGSKVEGRDKNLFHSTVASLTELETLSLCKRHDVGYWDKENKNEMANKLQHLIRLKHFSSWDCFIKP